ncbi:MAG TPA: transposase [Candidatus Udaeobacter sp.]|jgi:REP element-mobilizing transposase RayT|nr:transposase [Candidatus Udaeobacter sp.]
MYFVTACTYGRRKILNNADVHARLAQFGKEGPEHGACLGAYVLMPDHLHAFVKIDDQQLDPFTWVKSLKNALSKVLRMHNVPSPHWQKGFFDHVLRSDESYTQKWHYVRENPVRAGLSKDWRECPFLGEVFDLEFRDDRF